MAFPSDVPAGTTYFLPEDNTTYTFNGSTWDRTAIGPNNLTLYSTKQSYSGDSIPIVSQSGRSTLIFVDNADIAIIDAETIKSIPNAKNYLLCKAPITGDSLITEIASNAGENYYLYGYNGALDENFPYGAELIVKLTKEEAAICSLSPYFHPVTTGSIIEQATRNYPFLMSDRRELDKLRAAVSAYYLGQQYDNATVLAKQAFWQDALNAAVSGSIVSTWKVLNEMKDALSSGTAIAEEFLRYGRPVGGNVYDPELGIYKPANIYYASWAVSIINATTLTFGYNFNQSEGLDNANGSIVFNNPSDWTTFTETYDTISLIGPSGTYTWNLADAQDFAHGKYISMTTSAQIADLAAVETLIDELYAETSGSAAQAWTLRFANAAASDNEDEAVLDLVTKDMASHIIKYPRYGVGNPPTPQ